MQRIRVTYARGEATKFVGHLDLIRFWERAFRRAELPLAYSEGFNPRPRIVMAAPLPVGFTSDTELMDLYFDTRITAKEVLLRLAPQTPPGIDLLSAEPVDVAAPSLQSLMAACEYRVRVETSGRTREETEAKIQQLMDASSLPWEWTRDGEVKRLDLRSVIDEVWLDVWRGDEAVLGMRLVHDNSAAGRPEHVAQALGFPGYPLGIHRAEVSLRQHTTTPAQLAARLQQSARDRERAARRSPRPAAGPKTATVAPPPGGVDC